ncbi:MAG: ABC transporter ATP-binding protein [Planctomycetes bacterium]|nr:ABC transporter ATP-binding protein [Planctomycetota bacterium]
MAASAAAAVIEVDSLHKSYGNAAHQVPVLRGISFSVRAGESIAIVGHSGSGKSTLLNILGCLDVPTSGSYRLDGEDVAGMSDAQLARLRNEKIGFVFQSFNLIPHLTLLENVELPLYYLGWPRQKRRARALQLIERVGMAHRTTHRPAQLSGGESQRTAIARALANDPALLLADEPTGNLDSQNGEQILALFEDLHKSGMTVVVVTHDPAIAEQQERRIRMHDGVLAGVDAVRN